MTKEQLISYIEKGEVLHDGKYKIEVEKSQTSGYVSITLKSINEYTTDCFFGGFLEYMKEEDLMKMEEAFDSSLKKMKEAEEKASGESIKLKEINNLHSSSIASFKANNNREILLRHIKDNTAELVVFSSEPDYPISKNVEIKGKVIKPKYSFWLQHSTYNYSDFLPLLNKYVVLKEDFEKIFEADNNIELKLKDKEADNEILGCEGYIVNKSKNRIIYIDTFEDFDRLLKKEILIKFVENTNVQEPKGNGVSHIRSDKKYLQEEINTYFDDEYEYERFVEKCQTNTNAEEEESI